MMITVFLIWGCICVLLVSIGIFSFNLYFLTRKRLPLVLGWVASALCFVPTAILMLYFIIQNLP